MPYEMQLNLNEVSLYIFFAKRDLLAIRTWLQPLGCCTTMYPNAQEPILLESQKTCRSIFATPLL